MSIFVIGDLHLSQAVDKPMDIFGDNWQNHDTKIEEDWVVYSPSVLYSISLLIRLLTKPEDKIVVFRPMYDSFFSVIEDNDRIRIECEMAVNKGRFEIDFELLEKQLKEASMFLLCSPHNPTGRIWTKEELDRMIALCKKYDVPSFRINK